jgi:hypothetical protein
MTSPTLASPIATGDSSVVSNLVCFQQTRIGRARSRLFSWDVGLLGLAAFNSLFQIVWFWKYSSNNINYDAVSYIGIARHILDGNFHASLHGYWSPLISWCIVAGSLFSTNLLLVARVVTICSFLLCLPLVYRLSWLLWRSSVIASLSVLCFTLARQVVAFSVYFIGADFLMTAAVLGYFILLLQCLQKPVSTNWLKLGGLHSLAFLSKAFAMPWLALSTLLATGLLYHRRPKKAAACATLALIIPMVVWTGWGLALKTKYGTFTAGYQCKWNLLALDLRNRIGRGSLSVLMDTSRSNDAYMVVDDMYPGSPLWKEHLGNSTIRQVLKNEDHNLPEAIKQIIVLLTPGGLLALCLAIRRLHHASMRAEILWAWVIICTTLSLILGYGMLVFDARYVFPIVPLLIALGSRFLWPMENSSSTALAKYLPATLFFGSVIFLCSHSGSPFRRIRANYQSGLYAVSGALRNIPTCDRLVSVGEGPFPERGVGWEAGIYASYFAQCRIVGFSSEIPSPTDSQLAASDIGHLGATSVLVFGGSTDLATTAFLNAVQTNSGFTLARHLQLPGEKDAFLLLNNRPLPTNSGTEHSVATATPTEDTAEESRSFATGHLKPDSIAALRAQPN